MENRSHALIAGLFTLALLVAAVMAGLWFGRDRVERVPLVLVAEGGVGGLLPQAAVRYRGMAVGRVDSIGFDPKNTGRILVNVQVVPTTPVTPATTARMATQGVTGLAFIELDDDGSKPERLASTAEAPVYIPLRAGPLDEIMKRGTNILAGLEKTLSQVNQVLDGDNRDAIRRTLDDVSLAARSLRQTTEKLGPVVAEIAPTMREVRKTVSQAGQAAANAGQAATEVSALARSVKAVTDGINQPGGTLEQATRTLAELSAAASRLSGDTLPRINTLAAEGARAAVTVERAARAVGDSPRSVLFGNTPQPGPGEPGFPGFGATPAPRGTR
jgi:phospholipid/cholesterol/gamma-HCH transport system substrate-binding protein